MQLEYLCNIKKKWEKRVRKILEAEMKEFVVGAYLLQWCVRAWNEQTLGVDC